MQHALTPFGSFPRKPVAKPTLPAIVERNTSPGAESTGDLATLCRILTKSDLPALTMDVGLAPHSESNLVIGLDGAVRGVFVATYDEVEIGTRIELAIHLPAVEPVRAVAEVEWVRWSSVGAPPGIGLRFIALATEDRDLLQCFASHREPVFHEL